MSRVLAIVVPILVLVAFGASQGVPLHQMLELVGILAVIIGVVHLASGGTGFVR